MESPVAREARCGDSVREVTGGDGTFTVTEALRYQDDQTLDCAADGPLVVTRQVTLEVGWPVLSGGLVGEGGICPQWQLGTDAVWPADGVQLHAAPQEGSQELGEPQPDFWFEVDVSAHPFLWRPNWSLVHIGYL